jgi:hypothetical protein
MTSALLVPIILLVLALTVILASLKVVPERRRLAIVRLGRFLGLAGPGLVVVLPVFDRAVPLEAGREGLLLEGGTGDFGGIFIPVEAAFSGHKTGARIRIERFEGAGAAVKVIVGRAA